MEKEIKQSKFKNICVFCGSSAGKRSIYKEAAIELGRELVRKILLEIFLGFFSLFNFLDSLIVFPSLIAC